MRCPWPKACARSSGGRGSNGFRSVRAVVLEIGELAAVETGRAFCLDVVLADTLAAGAAIEVRGKSPAPAGAWIARRPVPMRGSRRLPRCGATAMQTTAGRGYASGAGGGLNMGHPMAPPAGVSTHESLMPRQRPRLNLAP